MSRPTHRPPPWLILSGLSLLLLACQGPTPTPTNPASDATGPARIAGTVVAESDVSGQPDVPLTDQIVAAVPYAALRSLSEDAPPLRFLSLRLEARPEGMHTAVTGAEGRYALTLPPGDYALCLAYPEGEPPTDPPLRLQGCGALTLTAGSTRTVDISSGFGEILLQEP